MGLYKHILLAVDLTEELDQLIDKVHQFAESTQADLSVIPVLELLGFRCCSPVYSGLINSRHNRTGSARSFDNAAITNVRRRNPACLANETR